MRDAPLTGFDLKRWRLDNGKSLREIAGLLRISASTVLRWEKSGEQLKEDIRASFLRLRDRGESETIRIAWSDDVWSSLLILAASPDTSPAKTAKTRRSFFKDEGVSIQLKTVPTGRDAFDSLQIGSVDAATVTDRVLSTGPSKFRPFATILRTPPLYGLSKKSIRITNPEDLCRSVDEHREPFKVGVISGTIAYYTVIERLEQSRVAAADWPIIVQCQPDPEYVALDLLHDKIDLFVGWQPHIGKAQQKLAERNARSERSRIAFLSHSRIDFHLVVAPDLLVRPNLAKGLARAMLEASEFIRTNPALSKRIVTEALELPSDSMLTDWNEYNFAVRFPIEVMLTHLIK